MGGPWEDYASQDSGPWNDYAPVSGKEPVQAQTWSDVPMAAVQNAPQSAYNFGKNIYDAVTNPVETAKGLYQVGKGVVSKVEGLAGQQQDPTKKEQDEAAANALWDFMKERYGSEEKLRNTLATDPVGALADIAGALTGGELLAGRLPVVGGIARAGGAVANVIDPLSVTAKTVSAAGKIGAKSLGLTTGVGGDAVKAAFEAGKNGRTSFLDHMRGNGDISGLIDIAQQYVNDQRAMRQADYLANTDALRAGSGASRLNVAAIDRAVADSEKIFKQGNFVKNAGAEAAYNEIKSVLDDWKQANPKPTPIDYDALKQRIGSVDAAAGSPAEAVRTMVYNSILTQLNTHVPQYAKAMSGYEEATKNLRELRKTFSLNPNASTDTAGRKILSILRDNVNTNFGQRKALGQQIANANPDFIPSIAGQTMRSVEPRGLSRLLAGGDLLTALHLHDPTMLAALPFSSPRIVGEGAYKAGQLSNFAPPPSVLNSLQQSGRLNQVPGLFEELQ